LSFHTFGFGPKAIGMGNAFTAVADDFTAAWYNPAGMTQSNQLRFGLGYQYMKPFMKVDGASHRIQDNHSLAVGVSTLLPFSAWLEERLYAGIAFYMPWNLVFGIKVPLPMEPQWVLLHNEPRDITIVPALGVKIHPALSVGANVILSDNTFGSFEATLTPENEAVLEVNQDLPTTFAPSAGLMFHPGEIWPGLAGWRFGFMWQDDFLIEYKFRPLIGIGYIPLRINFEAKNLFQPMRFLAGLSYAQGPDWLFSVELSYNLWSDMPDPNLTSSFDFVFPIFPVRFAPTRSYPPDFEDTLVPRVGAQGRVVNTDAVELALRLGYGYEPSPVPPQAGVTSYLDGDKHVVSFSPELTVKRIAGRDLTFPLSLGGYLQVQVVGKTRYLKDAAVFDLFPDYPYRAVEGEGTVLTVGIFFSTSLDLKRDAARSETDHAP